MFDPLSLLAVFGPLVVDAGKAAVSRFIAPKEFKPATIEQYESMRRLDLEMFKSMNDAGGTNPTYQWVEAVVRLMRPTVALIVLLTWSYLKLSGNTTDSVDNFCAAIGFYLFGDRTLFYARQSGGK